MSSAGPMHACDESVFAARRLLRFVWETFGSEARPPRACHWDSLPVPTIAESVERFVPTIYCTESVGWDSCRMLARDVDHAFRPRFVTSVHLAGEVRSTPDGRVQCNLAEAFLAPPALAAEADVRAELLESSGKGVPLSRLQELYPPFLAGRLTHREQRRLEFAARDELVALATVLACPGKPIVAFSPDATWPGSALVRDAAARLRCAIRRFPLSAIPEQEMTRVRRVRYEIIAEDRYQASGR